MKRLVYLSVAVIVAGTAWAVSPSVITSPASGATGGSDGVGSLISSFYMTGSSGTYALGIWRDSSYVYGIIYSASTDYLRSFTTAGSAAGSVALRGTATPRGAGDCHLGGGYVAVTDATNNRVYMFNKGTGSAVTSFSTTAANQEWSVMWSGTYYYTCRSYNPNSRLYYRYTSTGGSAGTWTASGYPFSYCRGIGYTNIANSATGSYMVAGEAATTDRHAIINIANGSLVRSWSSGRGGVTNGADCGTGAPTSHGTTYWVNCYVGGSLYAFQWDIDGSASSVEPASLGKVKALYR